MPAKSSKRVPKAGLVLLVIIGLTVVGYLVVKKAGPLLTGSGCQAGTGQAAVPLAPGQAAIASTIAGVAHRQALPPRAVVVAYAAALQESKLQDLSYGDRDSIGVFQQRPSEGWGPAAKLKDPVYASTKFFRALVGVSGYLHQPVYKAAQAVQRSADGSAYIQYQEEATVLAAGFTGHSAHDVWCWPGGPGPPKADLSAAHQALVHTFGPMGSHRVATPGDAPTLSVAAAHPALGWAVAVWLVTHADAYGIHQVSYAGFRWRAVSGHHGWTRDSGPARPGMVRAS
jgi:hypothetical protein